MGLKYLDFLRNSLDKSIAISTVSIRSDDNIIPDIPYFRRIASINAILSVR